MTEPIKPSYGFEITPVPEGHRVTYERFGTPTSTKVKIGCFAAFVPLFTLVMLVTVPLLGIPFLGLVGFVAFRVHRRYRARIDQPTTFLIGPESVAVGNERFDRKHITQVYLKDPSGARGQSYTSGPSGYVVGGAGAAGVGLATVSATTSAVNQSAQQFGESIKRDMDAISVSICFRYGEDEKTLANGLSPARGAALLEAVMKLLTDA